MGLSPHARLAVMWRALAAAPLLTPRLTAAVLFCALLLPFLLGYHRFPIPSFYQEWLAMLFALAGSVLVAVTHRGERFELPFAASIPLVLLPSVMVHLVAGNDLIAHGPLLYLIYIGSAVLLMIVGHKLGAASQAVSLADLMAAAFVTGALLISVANWHWRFKTGVVDLLPWERQGGWLGQSNHNGLYLWLGVLGLSHFALNRKVSWLHFSLGLGILVDAAAQTQSRSVYLYAACGLGLAIWAAVKSRTRDARRRLVLIGLLPVIFLVAVQGTLLLVTRTPSAEVQANPGPIHRYAPATVARDPRFGVWLTASRLALAHPWLGAGPASYVRESWVLADQLPVEAPITVPTTHTHNLFLQIAAELGTPSALALAALIGTWLLLALRQSDWHQTWLHVALPIALLTHNQLEFSLWYLYFLVPTALSMGGATRLTVGKSVPASIVLVAAVLGLGLAVRLDRDYQELEQAIRQSKSGQQDDQLLLASAAHPVFGLWASKEIARRAESVGLAPQQQDWHERRALYALPLAKILVLKHADKLEKSGKPDAAAAERRITRRVFGN